MILLIVWFFILFQLDQARQVSEISTDYGVVGLFSILSVILAGAVALLYRNSEKMAKRQVVKLESRCEKYEEEIKTLNAQMNQMMVDQTKDLISAIITLEITTNLWKEQQHKTS